RSWLLRALIMVPCTRLGLWLLGLERLLALLTGLVPPDQIAAADDGEQLELARTAGSMCRIAARSGFWRATCLPESLALWFLLRRQGIAAALRIGVRKELEQFQAHAWVEVAGLAVNDSDDVGQRFAAFERAIVPAGVCS